MARNHSKTRKRPPCERSGTVSRLDGRFRPQPNKAESSADHEEAVDGVGKRDGPVDIEVCLLTGVEVKLLRSKWSSCFPVAPLVMDWRTSGAAS